MGVDRNYRRQGLGQQLLAHAEHWAMMAGIQWIDLQVLSVNTPAIKLYESAGYRRPAKSRICSSSTASPQLHLHEQAPALAGRVSGSGRWCAEAGKPRSRMP
jgi:predicted N-acetyltransferase YhbS